MKFMRVLGPLLAGAVSCLMGEAFAERLALVIGNDAYASAPKLRNAKPDAEAMAKSLEVSGFRVTRVLDVGRTSMFDGIQRFVETVRPSDEVVVFYGGHAVELGGTNYLLPTDIRTDSDRSVQYDAVPLPHLLQSVAQQQPKFSLVIVDACRDNPFAGRTRNLLTRGLMPTGSKGQIVIYSASAGQKAVDGLFTQVFVKEIEKGGVVVQDVMRKVKVEVARRAKNQDHEQLPVVYDESAGDYDFYFRGGAQATQSSPTPGLPERCESDEGLWQEARRLDTAEGYEAYLESCGRGRYAGMAKAARKKLEAMQRSSGMVAPVAAVAVEPRAAITEPSPQPRTTGVPPGSTKTGSTHEDTFRDCEGCPEMVVIPSGLYEMGSAENEGSADERPRHRVNVERFALGKFEVTQGQWWSVMGRNPSLFSRCGDDCPVEQVSWDEAKEYVRKLNVRVSGQEGRPYRLPSEAEWEYACRGGARQTYCGDNDVDGVAWHGENSDRETHRTGKRQANGYGLYDMSGNVWEWVEDCWNGNYEGAPVDGSARMQRECSRRVYRGGSWDSSRLWVRATNRFWLDAHFRNSYLGFRVARTLP